jgi:16S rRNA (cytosine1402-N4)-methyltransferase
MIHTPVLKKEVLEYLSPEQNENFIDCTVGEGGHSLEILEKKGFGGKILGIDLDPHQIENGGWQAANYKDKFILVNDSYANLSQIVERLNFKPVHGILLDLGMSSVQIEKSQKGFSFKLDQGLDMRYNDDVGYLTAEKIINEWTQEKIAEILKNYGEEKYAKNIAQKIVEERKKGRIKTTFQLVNIIKTAIPARYHKEKIHFATRTFQALRIAVNDELENLKRVLPQIIGILSPGGRIVVISFHSLEDRIVKKFFVQASAKNLIKILTKKPITAKSEELGKNPRSRSAKLRAAIKL